MSLSWIFGVLVGALLFTAVFPTIYDAVTNVSGYSGATAVLLPIVAIAIVGGFLYSVLKEAGVM